MNKQLKKSILEKNQTIGRGGKTTEENEEVERRRSKKREKVKEKRHDSLREDIRRMI